MNDKKRVALHAASLVNDGMVVGLGTGSTADYFIIELARRYREEGLNITVVASSIASQIKAQEQGLPLVAIEYLGRLDLYIDGADEVAADNTLLKGQGTDLVKEKILAKSSKQFIVLADESKIVDHIGERFSIPIEVIPFAWNLVKQSLVLQGGKGELRRNSQGNGFAVSSHGSLILDISFDSNIDHCQLDTILNNTPGIVEHGIFYHLADIVLLAVNGKVQEKIGHSRT